MTRDNEAGMTCEMALERILEADPEELSGDVPSPLAGHLERCGRCRALAGEVLEGQAALASFLEGVRPRTGVGEALERARAGRPGSSHGRRSRWRRVWTGLPLAAAAAVAAGLFLIDGGGEGGPAVVTPSESRPADAFRRLPLSAHALRRVADGSSTIPRPPRVAVGSDAAVTVIRTSNPRISVVWITPESD